MTAIVSSTAAEPASATSNTPLVSEGFAKWLGIPLVSLFALGMAVVAGIEMKHILSHLVLIAIDVYVLLAVMYFWLSRSWKGGVTIKEVFYNTFWFLGLRRLIRSIRKDGIQHARGLHIEDSTDHSWKLINQKFAITGGILVTLVALVAVPVLVLIHVVHLTIAMIWFVMAVWSLCDAVYYLSGRMWDNGLSGREILLAIIGGPFAVGVRTVKAVRQHQGLQQSKLQLSQSAQTTLSGDQITA